MSRSLTTSFSVPMIDFTIFLVVTNSPARLRKWSRDLNDPLDNIFAACLYPLQSRNNRFALLFTVDAFLEPDTVTHEVFHLTHRLLDHAGVKFDLQNHEIFALVNAHVWKTVWKIREEWMRGEK